MDSKKIIFWPVLISIIGHIVLIMVTSVVDLRENVKYTEVYTVSIKEPEPETEQIPPKKEDVKKEVKRARQTKEAKAISEKSGWREDTVDLSNPSAKYTQFLSSMKRKLYIAWREIGLRKETGVVVLKISVDADGSVSGINLLSSSGAAPLAEDAVFITKAAAPYDNFPPDLDRLNITTTFIF